MENYQFTSEMKEYWDIKDIWYLSNEMTVYDS